MSTSIPINNRQAARAWLGEQGVLGHAAEVLLDTTAHLRHDHRVAMVKEVVRDMWPGECWPSRCQRELAVHLLVLADRCGVGGRHGVTGEATTRIPAFRGLGSGRKHARDGGAWDAAIMAASHNGTQPWHVYPLIGQWAVEVRSADAALRVEIGGTALPTAWARSLAYAALKAATQIDRHCGYYQGDLAAWAAILNTEVPMDPAGDGTTTGLPPGEGARRESLHSSGQADDLADWEIDLLHPHPADATAPRQ